MANSLQLVADIFTVTLLLALSFGSIGYVGARPQGTSTSSSSGTAQGSVTCASIQAQIYAQKPYNVSRQCDSCTKSVRTVTVCNKPIIAHVCNDGCQAKKSPINMSGCPRAPVLCSYVSGCNKQ